MVNYFLITRFNLKKTDWKVDKNAQEVLNDTWLNERVEIFRQYCLPSVIGQSKKDFKWLIFFEKDSKNKLENLLEDLVKYPFVEPIFLNGYSEFQEKLPDLVKKRAKPSTKWIVTTRLDNDDALHKNFFEEIHSFHPNFQNNLVLFFPFGLCFNRNDRFLAFQNFPLNQFVILVEKISSDLPQTVYCNEHNVWDDRYTIKFLSNHIRWLQITHNRNVLNTCRGSLMFTKTLKGFTLNEIKFPWYYDIYVTLLLIKRIIRKVKRIDL